MDLVQQTCRDDERLGVVETDILKLAQSAFAGARAPDALKGSGSGYLEDRCFVGETLDLSGRHAGILIVKLAPRRPQD